MRSSSYSPLKKMSSDLTKLVDSIPDPEKKKKKKKNKKNKDKKRDEDSSVSVEKRTKIEADEYISEEERVITPVKTVITPVKTAYTETRAKVEQNTLDKKEFDVDEIIAKLMSVQHKMPGTLVDLELATIH
jgi:hypothetical protein